jgi:hypothetical protein
LELKNKLAVWSFVFLFALKATLSFYLMPAFNFYSAFYGRLGRAVILSGTQVVASV